MAVIQIRLKAPLAAQQSVVIPSDSDLEVCRLLSYPKPLCSSNWVCPLSDFGAFWNCPFFLNTFFGPFQRIIPGSVISFTGLYLKSLEIVWFGITSCVQPLWVQQNRFLNVGVPFENADPARTPAESSVVSLSLASVSLPFSLSHLCLAGGQEGGEMALRGINRVGEDWKKINDNGGSKYFSVFAFEQRAVVD